MSSWTVLILEPARGMRTGHCSKTYQLGPFRSANSACFRDFLRLITDSGPYSHPPGPLCAPGPASPRMHAHILQVLPRTPALIWQLLPQRPIRSCSFSLNARSHPAGSPPTPAQIRQVLPERVLTRVRGGPRACPRCWAGVPDFPVRGERGLALRLSEVSGGFGGVPGTRCGC